MIETPCPAYFSRQPFDAADILKLAEFGPEPISPGSDHDTLAALLSSRFRSALDWVSMTEQSSSNNTKAKFFSNIQKNGRGLLIALGFEEKEIDGSLSLEPTSAMIQLMRNISDRAERIANAAASHTEKTSEGLIFWKDNLTSDRLIELLPYAISVAMSNAEQLHKNTPQIDAKSGPKANNFLEVLFNGLAFFHKEIFGCLPEIELTRGGRDGASVDWAQEILLLAYEKIPFVLEPAMDLHPAKLAVELEIQALSSAAKLSVSAIADRLKEGSAFARRYT